MAALLAAATPTKIQDRPVLMTIDARMMQAVDGAVDEPGEDDRGGAGDGEVQGHLGLPGGAAAGRHCRSRHLHPHQALIGDDGDGSISLMHRGTWKNTCTYMLGCLHGKTQVLAQRLLDILCSSWMIK